MMDFISKETIQKFTLFYCIPVWHFCFWTQMENIIYKCLIRKKNETALIFKTLNSNVHLQKVFSPNENS